MDYSGKIKLNDKEYDYFIKGYEMTIIDSRTDFFRKNKLGDILGKWLETNTDNHKKLKLKLSYKYFNDNAVIMNIDAFLYVLDLELDENRKNDEIHKLTFRSEVLDYFYRPQKDYIENVSKIINSFAKNDYNKKATKKYEFKYNNKNYILYFGINCYLKVYNNFMFDVFSSLNIECKENITMDEVHELSIIVKKFLSFISNNRKVYIDTILVNSYFDENIKYKNGEFYLNQSAKEKIEFKSVLNYDDIKENIGNIFDEIINDKICFISLFQYDKDYINTIDIMNICAAFESQFDVTYPKYRDDNFKKIKKEIINHIKLIEEKFSSDIKNKEVYDDILNSVKNYKDILKSKIEYALNDFEKLYNEESGKYMDIKYDFKDDYKEMPNRIKNARNSLDHGNNKTKITYKELTDTILLRAIVYFMILKSAGIDNYNIMNFMRKFTKFGV